MPWYDGNIPSAWQTALEKIDGAEFVTEVLFDPPNKNTLFNGKYDVVGIDPIVI